MICSNSKGPGSVMSLTLVKLNHLIEYSSASGVSQMSPGRCRIPAELS